MDKKTTRADVLQKLNTNYRIVFINDESLQEVASYKLTMRKLYVLFSTIFVVIVALTICVLLITPLKYYIPGYGNNKTHLQVIKLKRNVDSLSDLVAAQQTYEANMRKVISGDYDGRPDTSMLSMSTVRKEEMNNIYPVNAEGQKAAPEENIPTGNNKTTGRRKGHRRR